MVRLKQLILSQNPQNHLSEDINKKLLDQLYLHAKKSMVALLVLTIMLTFFITEYVPVSLVYPWSAVTVALIVSRIYDSYYYVGHDCSKMYQKWYNKFAYKSIITAALWGCVPILFLPYLEHTILHFLLSMLILGISGAAMNSLAADRRIATIYLTILLLPLGIHFLVQGSQIEMVLFLLILLYLSTQFIVNKNVSRILLESYQKEEALRQAKNTLFIKQDELNNLFQQTPVGVFHFDTNLRLVNCNTALCKMLDSKPNELIGLDLNLLRDQRIVEVIKEAMDKGTRIYHGPYYSLKGIELWVEAKCSPLRNDKGDLIGGVVLFENKTKEKKALDELEHMAKHDELTSLNNRRSFREYLFSMPHHSKYNTHYSVLFYLDLNQFKQINDSLGHTVGDKLLVLVAERLKNILGKGYVLSRLGGDEFTVIMPFCARDYDVAYKLSESFGEEIQKVFTGAFIIDELHLYIKSSIGIVIIEPNTENIEELIRYADISMYQAKREGHNRIAYYNMELDEKRKELFRLQHDLSHAIANKQLELNYQPIVNIEDDSVRACEALLRWNHPEKGYLAPSMFIDLAIESGLIDDIGWWVIDQVSQKVAEWKSKACYNIRYVSININAKQLQRYRFVESFFEVLEKNGVEPSDIKIEITERSLIDNFEQTNWVIRELQGKGVRCAIDDFGIGYSSLSYLQKLAFSVLKIDREFVKDIMTNKEDRYLVESIIRIAKRFNYRIVVEGIETEEQKALIQEIDPKVSYQGFLFSPPVPVEVFEQKYLKTVF